MLSDGDLQFACSCAERSPSLVRTRGVFDVVLFVLSTVRFDIAICIFFVRRRLMDAGIQFSVAVVCLGSAVVNNCQHFCRA